MRLANSLKSLVLVWQDSPYQASLGHGWGHQMNPNWVPGRQTFNCHALWSGKTNAIHRPSRPQAITMSYGWYKPSPSGRFMAARVANLHHQQPIIYQSYRQVSQLFIG